MIRTTEASGRIILHARRKRFALVAACRIGVKGLAATLVFLGLAPLAIAQEADQDFQPLKAAAGIVDLSTRTPQAPDFVRQSRPNSQTLDYAPLTGPDKERIRVKTPQEIEAEQAELLASRGLADRRGKNLASVKMAPISAGKPHGKHGKSTKWP